MRRLRDLTVGRRLTAAFSLMAVLLVLLMASALVGSAGQSSTKRALVADQQATAAVLQLKVLAAELDAGQTQYAFDSTRRAKGASIESSDSRKDFVATAAAFRSQLKRVRAMPAFAGYADDLSFVDAIFGRFMDIDARLVKLLLTGTPASMQQAETLVLGAAHLQIVSMTAGSQRIERGVEQHVAQRVAAADRETQLVRTSLIGITILALVLAALLAYLITRSLTRPLGRTVTLLREVAGGDLRGRVSDPGGDELGQMGTALNETLVSMGETVDGIAEGSATLSAASVQLSAVSQQMSAAAEETAARAGSVSVAAEQVSNNVQSVSAGTEELSTTVSEIARNTTEAAQVAAQAVRVAEQTSATVLRLGASSAEIGEVVKVITSIAEQTNMLALNATIEAARAGDVGKGFAVVAGEVKELARKTATSSEEIGRKIATIQQDTSAAVDAITQITDIVQRVNDIQTVIAAAVEEQAVTTNEIGRSVTEAADGTGDIARSITGVAETARGTTQGATETHRAAEELARLATDLLGLVRRFSVEGRALGAPPR